MRPTLPRPIPPIPRAGAILLAVGLLAFACVFCVFSLLGGCRREPFVAPGPLIPAESEVAVGTMQVECDAMHAALETWKRCPNLVEDETETIDAWLERSRLDLAAGTKANPEAKAQQAIAVRCRKATDSVKAATERCSNGPRPKS